MIGQHSSYIRGRDFGTETNYFDREFFVLFISLPHLVPNLTTTTAFHMIPSSLFTNHSTLYSWLIMFALVTMVSLVTIISFVSSATVRIYVGEFFVLILSPCWTSRLPNVIFPQKKSDVIAKVWGPILVVARIITPCLQFHLTYCNNR